MNENYIVINGNKAELTEEQLKALGIEVETKRKNPFGNQIVGENYFSILSNNDVQKYHDDSDLGDSGAYNAANYFNDEAFAYQVALHQLLYRKLLKFAYDNGFEDTVEWKGENQHWCIYYSNSRKRFETTWHDLAQYLYVYFSTREGANHAIKEVVEPFVKEHPEFVW